MNLAWYVARAAGVVSWALLGAATIWGLLLSIRRTGSTSGSTIRRTHRGRGGRLDLHRFMGGLATVFVLVHVAAILLDTYVAFGITEVLVPFTADYRPAAVAWGVVALYLVVAVELTSLARRRLPRRLWHLVHLASFPLYFLATIHLLTAGTDASHPALRLGAGATALAVAALTLVRLSQPRRPTGQRSGQPSGRRSGATPQLTHS